MHLLAKSRSNNKHLGVVCNSEGIFMDFGKIRLNNERNSHVVKRLNRLSTTKFFGVLYRENMFRLFGFSLLMIICMAPIFGMQFFATMQLTELKQTLPTLNGFGFSTGVWMGVDGYYAQQVASKNVYYGLLTVASSLLVSVVFSGGFAVIRDSFWTGKLSKVGVFRSIGKGIAANFLYAVASVVIIAFGVFGIFMFYPWAATVMPVWLAIVLTVVLSLVLFLITCYLMILCSVAVTYKQTLYENLDDSWRLLWLNFLPNILHLIMALLPIPLYFAFSGGSLQILYITVLLFVGGMYFPLVWHTHMMRTFALFHPVASKKKKEVRKELEAMEQAQAQAKEQKKQRALEKKQSNKKAKVVVKPAQPTVKPSVKPSVVTEIVTEETLVEDPLAEETLVEVTEETSVTSEAEPQSDNNK